MKRVVLPEKNRKEKLSFFLALEEYLSGLPEKDFFVIWDTKPTVIIGRNQVLESEVNLPFCRENNVDIFRRKSGGGCVYSDKGNIMLSYVTDKRTPEEAFNLYLKKLAESLSKLGFNAVKTTNNDLLTDGKKVSGNAYYGTKNASIVHGTLLYNMNFSDMEKAITPSAEKVAKHGIQSVRQRVVNLSELNNKISIDQLKDFLVKEFCEDEYLLSEEDVAKIKEIEKDYLIPEFINGKD